jgi:lactoylglutathione lyase
VKYVIAAAICVSLAWGQEVKRPRITGVARIAFYAHDLEASRAFYTDFLGFQVASGTHILGGPMVRALFKINDRQYVELLPEIQAATDRLVRFALETDNAAAMLAYLASRGVKTPARVEKDSTGNSSFTVTDPDGHIVEFVQFEPDGLNMRSKGGLMNDRRAATEMNHIGFIVSSLEPAFKFYREVLGCKEIWRGSQDGKFLTWVNMKVPDGEDYVEFMLYDTMPGLRQLGVLHHIGLVGPDMGKTAALLESQPGRKAYTRPLDIRGTRRRQIQVYDPDGTRTEVMEPVGNTPQVSSTAPPIR